METQICPLKIKDNVEKQKSVPWFLYFSGITADLLFMAYGMCVSWSSPVIQMLQSNDTNVNPLGTPATPLDISILTAIPYLAAIISYIILARVIDRLGRKATMILLALISTCGLITTAFTSHIYIYFVSISVTGVCTNGELLAVALYNSEIAENTNRGKLGCLMGLSVQLGICLGYVFGPLTNFKWFTLICSVPNLIFLLLCSLICESPTHLLRRSKVTKAFKALERLRGIKNAKEIEIECEALQEIIRTNNSLKRRSCLYIIKIPSLRRGLLLGIGVYLVQQLSGILNILSYVGPVFNEAGSGLSGNNVGIIVGLFTVIMYLITANIIERLGKRTLILFSSFFSSLSMFFLGMYFYLKHIESRILASVPWISIVFVILYIMFYGLGLGPIPIGLVGELFPEDLRAKGVASVFVIDSFVSSFVVFSFPLLAESYGTQWCFFIHSLFSIIGFIGLYFFMPDTKGKSFLEIQNSIIE